MFKQVYPSRVENEQGDFLEDESRHTMVFGTKDVVYEIVVESGVAETGEPAISINEIFNRTLGKVALGAEQEKIKKGLMEALPAIGYDFYEFYLK